MKILYPQPTKRGWWFRIISFEHTKDVVGLLSALLLVGSIVYGFCTVKESTFEVGKTVVDGGNAGGGVLGAAGEEESKTLSREGIFKLAVLMFWIVIPPIWFWVEYVGLYRYDDPKLREAIDQFKYTQDLAGKVWLALVTALTILYFGKDIHM